MSNLAIGPFETITNINLDASFILVLAISAPTATVTITNTTSPTKGTNSNTLYSRTLPAMGTVAAKVNGNKINRPSTPSNNNPLLGLRIAFAAQTLFFFQLVIYRQKVGGTWAPYWPTFYVEFSGGIGTVDLLMNYNRTGTRFLQVIEVSTAVQGGGVWGYLNGTQLPLPANVPPFSTYPADANLIHGASAIPGLRIP